MVHICDTNFAINNECMYMNKNEIYTLSNIEIREDYSLQNVWMTSQDK